MGKRGKTYWSHNIGKSKQQKNDNTRNFISRRLGWFQPGTKRKDMMDYEKYPGVSQQTMFALYDIANEALEKPYSGEKVLPVANTEYKAASSLLSHIGSKQTPRTFTRGETRPIKDEETGRTMYAKKTTLAVGKCLVTISTID